jgi:hypothetical protein
MGAVIIIAAVFAVLAAFAVLAVRFGADSRVVDPRGSLIAFNSN